MEGLPRDEEMAWHRLPLHACHEEQQPQGVHTLALVAEPL